MLPMEATTKVLLTIAVCLVAGLFMSRFAKLFKLPAVTGYLVAGLLIGPCCLGLLKIPGIGFSSIHEVEELGILCDIALGFIAFAIGNEFRLSQLRRIGRQATIVGVFQALVTAVVVDIALIALHFIRPDVISLETAITLGAIATATAPAATLMVVRQYKAKGPLTDILLPVVALDDAVGLVVFAVSLGIAKALSAGSISMVSVLVNPLIEIIGSLLLGLVMGIVFSLCEKFFLSNSKRLALSITFVILTVALAQLKFEIPGTEIHIGFSNLLVCMMLGTVFCNVCDFSEELMGKTDKWTAPLFILFFVLSGAELDLTKFASLAVVGVGIIYIISRSAGKYFGAKWSAAAAHCTPSIRKWLGVTLLPQAGVALGMSVIAKSELGGGDTIRNIVLFGVLIYELFGPLLTKIALTKAGDIQPKQPKVDINPDEDEE